MPFNLKGKTALVTGSGRGIGRAIASTLASAGASVMLNDLDEAAVTQTENELRSKGYSICHSTGDLTDTAYPDLLIGSTLSTFGSIDIIVNNAGYSWDSVIQKTTDEQFLAMLEIHLLVPFRVLRAASGYIRDAAKKEAAAGERVMRKVVNITSIAGTDGNPGQAATPWKSRRHRPYQNACEGVGPLQRERKRGRLRPDRNPSGSVVAG